MPISISQDRINEIAQELDAGMKCFYHIPTGEIKSYPNELKGHAGFEEEFWEDTINEIESAYEEYIAFEAMESWESFRMIETFISNITEEKIRRRFEYVITLKRPFQQFKYLLNDYPDLRQQWFDFKNTYLKEYVQEQLEAYNSLNNQERY